MSGLFTVLQPAEFDSAFGLSLKEKQKEKENKHEL